MRHIRFGHGWWNGRQLQSIDTIKKGSLTAQHRITGKVTNKPITMPERKFFIGSWTTRTISINMKPDIAKEFGLALYPEPMKI